MWYSGGTARNEILEIFNQFLDLLLGALFFSAVQIYNRIPSKHLKKFHHILNNLAVESHPERAVTGGCGSKDIAGRVRIRFHLRSSPGSKKPLAVCSSHQVEYNSSNHAEDNNRAKDGKSKFQDVAGAAKVLGHLV